MLALVGEFVEPTYDLTKPFLEEYLKLFSSY